MVEIKVTFSHALISATRDQKEAYVGEGSLREVLEELTERYGGDFKRKILNEEGRPKRFINIYINGKDMRFLEGLETRINGGDQILIIPAVSGG